uniref:Peptidylglycine monooxygenase n=1 Tax=Macrostomum lignano TaxID=282301 RepID=A0A1I8GTK7_9PLAT
MVFKSSQWQILTLPLLLLATPACSAPADTPEQQQVLKVEMPGAAPTHDDSYLCSSTKVPANAGKELYIVGFQALSDMSVAHHVLLYGCQRPQVEPGKVGDCGGICSSGGSKIVYAWARNAPELRLPANTGFVIGGASSIQYIVIQVHYLHGRSQPDRSAVNLQLSSRPQPFTAGIFLMMAYSGSIQPGAQHATLDVSCKYSGSSEMRPFAFRTHAHALSRAIVGYRLSPDLQDVQEIGRASPQWAQAFYPARPGISIRNGDYLAARCVYDATGETQAHHIGSTHNDEMCNFYIMFSTPAGAKLGDIFSCGGGGPDASTESRRLWRKIPQDSLDYLPSEAPADAFAYAAKATAPRKGVPHPPPAAAAAHKVAAVPDWPRPGGRQLGQISGVAAGPDGRVFVFHRGARVWGPGAFDPDNRLSDALQSEGAINEDTVLELDASGGVLKFSPDHKPLLTVGVRLTPADGKRGFCQPADAVTSSAGDVFVADGYCNHRVVMLGPDGSFKREFQSADGVLVVPHSLALIEADRLVCVADRERARVECWNWETGRSERRFASKEFGDSVYAVAYSPEARQMYAVSGSGHGLTVDPTSGAVRQAWGSFTRPHAMAVAAGGAALLVAEIQVPGRLWKFSVSGLTAQSNSPDHFAGQRTVHERALVLVRDSQASLLIGLLLLLPLLVVVLAVALLKLRRRDSGRIGAGRKSLLGGGPGGIRDREGFQPLTQEDSDEEAETGPGAGGLGDA